MFTVNKTMTPMKARTRTKGTGAVGLAGKGAKAKMPAKKAPRPSLNKTRFKAY